MRRNLAWAGALALSIGVVPAQAHHSMAMFDSQQKVTVTGKVREFQWTNPHCYIQLVEKDKSGATKEWSMEMGAPMYLYARGWRPSSIKAGDTLTITIHPLRNGKPGGVVLEAVNADGKTIGKPA